MLLNGGKERHTCYVRLSLLGDQLSHDAPNARNGTNGAQEHQTDFLGSRHLNLE